MRWRRLEYAAMKGHGELQRHTRDRSNVVSNFRFGYSEVVLGTGKALLVVVLFEGEAFSGADNFA